MNSCSSRSSRRWNAWIDGKRRFAHTDRADFLGLHQRDFEQRAELLRERRRGHPSGGAASGDDHFLYDWRFHSDLFWINDSGD